MSRLPLTPAVCGYAGVVQTLTALTGSTGVSWSNTGREILVVSVGSTATTITENIGAQVLGQGVTAFSETPGTTATTTYGPFPAVFDQPASGTNQIYLDFSSVVNVSVQLLQIPGVN